MSDRKDSAHHEHGSYSVPPFFNVQHVNLKRFETICSQTVVVDEYCFATSVEGNVLIYEGDRIREILNDSDQETELLIEWNRCLDRGPGVFVVKKAYPDQELIDTVTHVFQTIIRDEQAAGQGRGDHFGNNERIWNSIQKVCLRAPELFINYYGNPILALASRAWLGPYYQITAQVNNVKPGSRAQSPHRDYHLGFQSHEVVTQFPAQTQVMSQYLTLQGAVAHTDMPIESGPTLFLPFSHQFAPGYMAYNEPAFIDYFDRHHVQLPLRKGDAVFFSPALFHGAGTNQSAHDRLANLVQISSAFGRPMESIDRYAMIEAVYPALVQYKKEVGFSQRTLDDTIAALADGYSFPTNLDSDPPIGGKAPETAQQMLAIALEQDWIPDRLKSALVAYAERRQG